MHWILAQNILQSEPAYPELVRALEVSGTPHQTVKVIPFSHQLDGPDINPQGDVFPCGSYAIKHVSKAKGWNPGYIDENLEYAFTYDACRDYMLNYDAEFVYFRDYKPSPGDDPFFVRPNDDAKQFAGTMMTPADFLAWQKKVVDLGSDEDSRVKVSADDLIVVASPKNIAAEYRFMVIDSYVITGSMYKRGGIVHYSPLIDPAIQHFAEWVTDTLLCPNEAFVVDIADTERGPVVIETNSINSSGFYACDMQKFVQAINEMST